VLDPLDRHIQRDRVYKLAGYNGQGLIGLYHVYVITKAKPAPETSFIFSDSQATVNDHHAITISN